MGTQQTLPAKTIAQEINEVHASIEGLRSKALDIAAQAVERVVKIGHLLEKAKKQVKQNNWTLWVESNLSFSLGTASNYIKAAAHHSKAVESQHVDFKTVKELYIACGIMPEPSHADNSSNDAGDPFRSLWSMTTKLEHFIPRLDEAGRNRLRDWWTRVGNLNGWSNV